MEKLVCIHGSLGTKKEFSKILPFLESQYEVILYEIPHHGERKDAPLAFSLPVLVNDFLAFLDLYGAAYVYGFSLGGYLAIAATIQDSKNIKGIVTQGTKFRWNKQVAAENIAQMQKEPSSKGEIAFRQYLETLHGDYLPQILQKTIDFTLELGDNPIVTPENVKNLKIPVRITRGGKDAVASREGSLAVADAISSGYYFEVPHLIHPIGFVSPKHIARHIAVQLQSMQYHRATTRYGKMAYKTIGNPIVQSGPVLLFLHESLGSIAQWQDFPNKLCQHLGLPGIVIEFPGYGFSDKEDKVRDERYLHDFSWEYLPAFTEAIDLTQPLVLVGHSDGGTNALLFSSRFPNKVKGIITLAAHYLNEMVTRAGIYPAIDAYNEGKMEGLEFFHGDKTNRLFHAWSDTWLSPNFENWNIEDDIRGCSVPALIIQGENDQYGSKEQVNGITHLLSNAVPCFLANCGHQPHLEMGDFIIPTIKMWYFSI